MASGARAAQVFVVILSFSLLVSSLPQTYYRRQQSFVVVESTNYQDEYKRSPNEWASICAYLKTKEKGYNFNPKFFSKANNEVSMGVAIASLSILGFKTPPFYPRRAETTDTECETKQLFVRDGQSGYKFAVAGISFVVNVVFFALLVAGCYNGFLPKKRYTLLANRSVIDALMSLLTFAFLLAKHEDCDMENQVLCMRAMKMVYPVPLYLLQVGLTLNYWMLSVSYSTIALLTWYAVKFPLEYRIKLSTMRIIQGVAVVWIVSCALLVAYSRLSGMEIFKSNAMIVLIGVRTDSSENAVLGMCKEAASNKTGRFDHIAALGLPVFGFFCTLGSYALVCVLLVQKRKVNRLATRQFAGVWRLGIHIICLTFSCTLMAVAHFANNHVAESCRSIQSGEQSLCEEMRSLEIIYTFVAASSIGTIAWFVRMIVDSLLDIVMDSRIHRALRQRLHNHHAATSSSLLMLSDLRLSHVHPPVGRTVLGRLPSTSRTDSLYSMVSRC